MRLIGIATIGLVLAALYGAALVKAAQREADSRSNFPPQGEFITVNGTAIHAVVMGEGRDVVLISGGSGNFRDMTFRLAPMLAQDYRVLVLDRPGLGYSDPLSGDESIAAQADQLQAAAEAMGAERPIVLGHSYGVAVALAWAIRHPDTLAGVVGVSGATHKWAQDPTLFVRIAAHPIGGAFVVPFITAFTTEANVHSLLDSIFWPQSMPEGYVEWGAPALYLQRSTFQANARHQLYMREEMATQEALYGQIGVPVELVHGTGDMIVPFEANARVLSDLIPGSVLTPTENVGHMPHQVATKAVAAAVGRISERVALGKRSP